MKKTILITAATAFIALIGTQAFACYWDGYWGGPMGGPMAGYSSGNYQGFYDQTAQLRQDWRLNRANTTRCCQRLIPIRSERRS